MSTSTAADTIDHVDELVRALGSGSLKPWQRAGYVKHARKLLAELGARLAAADAELWDAFDDRKRSRTCSECPQRIPASSRRDQVTCSQPCRQRRARRRARAA